MPDVTLAGCTATPFGSYLKALAVLRLVAEQADSEARLFWRGDTPVISSGLDSESLLDFFLDSYSPTPILAPWNKGSGFYRKDRKVGIDALANSADPRFREYRECIGTLRPLNEIAEGDADKLEKNAEDQRRLAILLACRNLLSDRAVEWIDAAVGIAADGQRSFAPVLGTGGNEGRLDYTNNFMERLATLLVQPDPKTPRRDLLAHALFNRASGGLQAAAAGQFDPGRAGGANQGQGISHESATNPWDLVLTLEGAVAWASGLHRRQGVAYRSFLCSPFTVRAVRVGYASASAGDDARAEIWAPLWTKPAAYNEIKTLLREGRSAVNQRPAQTGLQFAEAVCSLGVDRGIDRFVRFNLLKRRGDSYVALPVGTFSVQYRSASDRIRELAGILETIDSATLPPGCADLRRAVDTSIYDVLLRGGARELRSLVAALGRLLRRMATVAGLPIPQPSLPAREWLSDCGADASIEVRIAAALVSIYDAPLAAPSDKLTGSLRDHLQAGLKDFSWTGRDLLQCMISVLDRRLQRADAVGLERNPGAASFPLYPGDASLFIDGGVDDMLIQDLLFGFTCLTWADLSPAVDDAAAPLAVLPVYCLIKHLFLPHGLSASDGELVHLRADPRILALLRAGDITRSADLAVQRLRIAGLRPLNASYLGGVPPDRLAAALLIPIRRTAAFSASVLKPLESQLA